MVIALTKESFNGEKRVGLTPDSIKKLTGAGFTLQVQAGAGSPADFTDKEYEANGAAIKADFAQAVSGADVVVKVRPPSKKSFPCCRRVQPAWHARYGLSQRPVSRCQVKK